MLISIDVEEADLREFVGLYANDWINCATSRTAKAIEKVLEPEVTFTIPLLLAKAMAAKSDGVIFGRRYEVLAAAAQKALKQC